MTAIAYSLLLRNGQSIPVANFSRELERLEFDSSIDLTNESVCWLRDSSASELTEIRILRCEAGSQKSWRCSAEAVDVSKKPPSSAGDARRGLRRFLMPWSRA